ncbi:MAG: oligopeptide:H+ symporter [Gammaproteobacteria bacterium]|nr:oligopeptide:H+ symporter [Gammaproteobacteria bacterium]MDE2024275.1 oligopeptide:H+ symporter [Gammaproteobacteria bacterium]
MTPADVMSRPQPRKAFLVLFAIEIWERFGYYGMASLMVLYMVERLGMGDARADLIWGAFSALVYSMPMLGGYVGDRVLGARRTLVLGAITLGLGYVLLSVPLTATFFPAMGLIALGNGLFKVNPNNLASRLYEGDHSRLDILFTLYYTSLNIGSFVSILLTPWIKDHPAWILDIGGLQFDSWHLAFGLSAVGLTLGLINYAAFQRYLRPYGTAPDFAKLNWRKLGAVILVSLVIAFVLAEIIRYRAAAFGVVSLLLLLTALIFIRLLRSGDAGNRRRVVACIIFICISAIWAVYNQQIYTSLTLFALRNVRHELLGVQVSAAQFQDLNQFWLVVLAAPLAWLYHRMNRSARGDFSIATKYAAGLYLLALAFFLYAASGFSAEAGIVSPWWLVAGYAAQSLGELLISALGFSMVSQLVPERSRGIIMGTWFLGMGVSNYAGGAIAGLAHVHPGLSAATATLPIYMRLFGGLAIGALICAVLVTAAIPLLKSLSAPDHDRAALQPAGIH